MSRRKNKGPRFKEVKRMAGIGDTDELSANGRAEMDERGFRLNATGLRYADSAAQEFLRLEAAHA